MDSTEFKQRLAQSGMTRAQAALSLDASIETVHSLCTGRRVCTSEMACLVQKWPSDGSLVQTIESVVQERARSAVPVVQSDAVYKSSFGPEWDIVQDGYARGSKGAPPVVRCEALTAFAYFRIVQQETGFNVMANRVTRKEFDAVDWKRLGLPGFDRIGRHVRDRLPGKGL